MNSSQYINAFRFVEVFIYSHCGSIYPVTIYRPTDAKLTLGTCIEHFTIQILAHFELVRWCQIAGY